ncbi:MAG: LamG-like jellyroll fold domain-containing protein, partial [Candidatus Nanohaloarchaea archaeon]
MEVSDVGIPSGTDVDAVFQALDSSGSVVDKEVIDLSAGTNTYSLNVKNSEDAQVKFNGTSTNESRSWEVKNFTVDYSSASAKTYGAQSDWNSGTFNGTSADRKINSGTLGIGYLNGSNPQFQWNQNLFVRFDETSGEPADYSGNGYNAVVDNNVASSVKTAEGLWGTNAWDFLDDGNEGGVIYNYNESGTVYQNGQTVSVWVKWDGTDSNTNWQRVATTDCSEFWCIIIDDGGNDGNQDVRWSVNDGSNNPSILSSSSVSDKKWHHIVGVYDDDAGEIRIYVDGVLENSTSVNVPTGGYTGGANRSIAVGCGTEATYSASWDCQKSDTATNMNGKIDDVINIKKDLTGRQIKELYRWGKPFHADYTSSTVVNGSSKKNWKTLTVDAPTENSYTELTAVFEALDNKGSVVDSQSIGISQGTNDYSLSVSNSDSARVKFNGTSSNTSHSWEVKSFTLDYSSASTVTKVSGADTQEEWNQGVYRGTSTDRDANSGVLGLGYTNKTRVNSSILAHWQLEATSGSYTDYVGQDNTGTVQGTLDRGVTGLLGTEGFHNDGTAANYVNVSQPLSYSTNSGTFAVWVNHDSLTGEDASTSANWMFYMDECCTNPNFRLGKEDTGGGDGDTQDNE